LSKVSSKRRFLAEESEERGKGRGLDKAEGRKEGLKNCKLKTGVQGAVVVTHLEDPGQLEKIGWAEGAVRHDRGGEEGEK